MVFMPPRSVGRADKASRAAVRGRRLRRSVLAGVRELDVELARGLLPALGGVGGDLVERLLCAVRGPVHAEGPIPALEAVLDHHGEPRELTLRYWARHARRFHDLGEAHGLSRSIGTEVEGRPSSRIRHTAERHEVGHAPIQARQLVGRHLHSRGARRHHGLLQVGQRVELREGHEHLVSVLVGLEANEGEVDAPLREPHHRRHHDG